MDENKQQLSFEEKLARIEEIVKSLESGQLSLKDALDAYQEATALGKALEATLDEAEKQLQVHQ